MNRTRSFGQIDLAASALQRASELQRIGDLPAAIAAYEAILIKHPKHPEAHRLLAVAALASGDAKRAVHHAQRAVRIAPDVAITHQTLGEALAEAGDGKSASLELQTSLRIGPKSPSVMAYLGSLLTQLGDFVGAERWLDEALRLQSDLPAALFHKSALARETHKIALAAAFMERFLATGASPSVAWSNLGTLRLDLGDPARAVAAYRRAIELDPEARAAQSDLLHALLFVDGLAPESVFAEHVAIGERMVAAGRPAPARRIDRSPGTGARPLRIGYVSPDLRQHPVALFFEPILRHHDRARVHVTCYSDASKTDETTLRLRALSDAWCDSSELDDAALIARVADDRIDVLVDLAVHSGYNRQRVFASRAAPLQASWLGYAATTGLRAMDLRLTESLHTERLARLPKILWSYAPPTAAPSITEKSSNSSANVRFLSLSRLAKINDRVLDAWCEILRAVPGSTVTLQAAPFAEATTRDTWLARFRAREIDPTRVELRASAPMREYLRAMSDGDVALDTFPFCGGTTTCNALWMGCPVVTLAESVPWSRVSASVLTSIGLASHVAHSVPEYVAKSIALAHDVEGRAELRRTLRDRMTSSPLMDAVSVARAVEDAFEAASVGR
jgi:predicted O-linked N-acetylglucosamine transferase (SPINDLY family)